MITLSQKQWAEIYRAMAQEYPPSYLLVREVTKRELGFTPRTYRSWDARIGYTTEICLDFFDEGKEAWFRLKYL